MRGGMYQPAHHREDRLDLQHALIEAHSLGLLITSGTAGLVANFIPFLLKPAMGSLGTLQAHLARANGQWCDVSGREVLVVFQGPQNYISPSFYETKRETGKVVPTWNYVVVQARGVAKVIEDGVWLSDQIEALTNRHEGARDKPWAVSDAPQSYIESQLRGIVGIEIEIASIEGKWKVSQNRPEADRRGVAEGLAEENADMAAVVREFGNLS
jgi:transcriptional regulator